MTRIVTTLLLLLSICGIAWAGADTTTSANSNNDLGKTVYDKACSTCHAPQLAKGLGAPAAFDKQAWQPRLAQAEVASKQDPERYKTPYDYLLYQVKIGKGLMHHGGLCRESNLPSKYCSDDALIAAIEYMSQ